MSDQKKPDAPRKLTPRERAVWAAAWRTGYAAAVNDHLAAAKLLLDPTRAAVRKTLDGAPPPWSPPDVFPPTTEKEKSRGRP